MMVVFYMVLMMAMLILLFLIFLNETSVSYPRDTSPWLPNQNFLMGLDIAVKYEEEE